MLHCPATIVVARPVAAERQQDLVAALRDRRVALVYSGADAATLRLADSLAAEFGVGARELAELTGLDAATSRADLAARLETVADLHRGETVLVLADRGPSDAAPLEVEIGDDGVRFIRRTD